MTTRRITPNLPSPDPAASARFWQVVFGAMPAMDHGWIVTLNGPDPQPAQISLASQGGSGTDLPAVSVEVTDLDATLARARAEGAPIPYGPISEPWGVRRFFLRDPGGNLVNVLAHET